MMNEWWFRGLIASLVLIIAVLLIRPLRCGLPGRMVSFFGVLILSLAGYFAWGDYFSWNGFLKQQHSKEQALALMKQIKDPQEVILKIQKHLEKEPDSAQGWFLLGRLYSHQNQSDLALKAFEKAYLLEGLNEQYAVHYAHGLWVNNNGEFNARIRSLFERLVTQNPNQPDALAMLAMDSYLSKDYTTAIDYWQRLLELAPPQSDEAKALRKAIAKARRTSLKINGKPDKQ